MSDPTKLDLERCRADPIFWARTVLGVHPWSRQIEIIESVRDNPETAVKSCHAAGKDWTAAVAVLWFLFNHQHSLVITTGPTSRQVEGILWKEIGMMHRRARWPLGGKLLTKELNVDRDWRAFGFTAPDYDPDKFQGYHAPHILVVLDEAAGISSEIYEAVDSVLSAGNARRLEIGNPTDGSSEFAKSFKTVGVNKITISALDTPNFTSFGITHEDLETGAWEDKVGGRPLPAPHLVRPEWAAKMLRRHGPDSVFFRSRVLAQFPPAGKDTLIPLAWIEAAQQRSLDPSTPHRLSLDVGRGGDPSIIGERRGPVYRKLSQIDSDDTMVVAGHLVQALTDTEAPSACIDSIGIGAGVYDRCMELGKPVEEAVAGSKAMDPERYANARAEWNWTLRELFRSGEIDIDEHDEELASQLCEIRWKPDSKGRVTIESKDDMKKRLGRSPDDADAMAIAYAPIKMVEYAYQGIAKTDANKSLRTANRGGGFKRRGGIL